VYPFSSTKKYIASPHPKGSFYRVSFFIHEKVYRQPPPEGQFLLDFFSRAKSKYGNAEKNLKCHPMERLKTDQLHKGELLQVFQTRINTDLHR